MNHLKKNIRFFSSAILLLLLLQCCNHAAPHSRLLTAASPYLQQHADNPVDWYQWNDETLALAKKENKPLLISIGYASCHWCHVMETESFMDTAVARLMNENFINIKVDREERPDIDNIYMNACQLLSGSGGWPLNAFALPDGKPFFAGTYYSKQSWMNLLKQVAQSYKEKNELVVKQANALTKGIVEDELSFAKNDNAAMVISKTDYQTLFDSVYKHFDVRNGGLKGSPKFPMPSLIEFLLQHHYLTGNKLSLYAATNTLTKMALGGLYDQVGGGFARYATDSNWRIPHFEKMLYDNGQMVSLYAHAYQLTNNDFFKTIIAETIAFVERDLTAASGGFYSSLNADTDDGEGAFYAWTQDEFKKSLGGENAALLTEYFNVAYEGNWQKGKNILYASHTPDGFARIKKQSHQQFISVLNITKKNLLAERNKRTKPAVDKKILTAWNAIMLKGYADAYAATANEAYLQKALSLATFLEQNMLEKNGSLTRSYVEQRKITGNAFLDDYAWTATAFVKLYQVTFNKHWLTLSKQIVDYAIANFHDGKSVLFYYTNIHASTLAVRKMEVADNALPSSNAMMASVLYELAIYFDEKDYQEKSRTMLSALSPKMFALPAYYAKWCYLAGLFSYGSYEVAIMGNDAHQKNRHLQKNYLPTSIYLGETDEENLPLLQEKLTANKTMIYVCSNKVCRLPVEDVDKAVMQINKNFQKNKQ